MERTKGPYNIGDLLIIPGGHKFGIIIDEYKNDYLFTHFVLNHYRYYLNYNQ